MRLNEKSILTINAGSSSIKFALFAANQSLCLMLKGKIERIGLDDASFTIKTADQIEENKRPVLAKDFPAAVKLLLDWVETFIKDGSLIALGHRIVHGGQNYYQPTPLTDAMLTDLRALTSLDPGHLPQEILLAETLRKRFSHLLHIACFDTGFHHDLPWIAQLLPIPRHYHDQGIRRYGFHGLSYEFLMGELIHIEGDAVARGRIVLAHLGSGASLAAVHGGRPIDTSMGFSPASGVPMGTRSGDLDPGLLGYFARTNNMSADEFNDMIHFKSGLLGISETSGDMLDLLQQEKNDPRAAEAIALFCYQIKKWIGAYAAALGGLDTLIFTGGIGENIPVVRARICAGLEFLDIELDPARNQTNADRISAESAGTKVRVMRTNEELVIARSVYRFVSGKTD